MTANPMPFRGSLTSREQVAVYEFSWPVVIFVPMAAIAIQAFLPVRVRFFPILDLPMMVVIFFATARRNPITGCLTGAVIGLLQDSLAGMGHPIGMFGIADTIIGFAASSLVVKIDVDNHGTRCLLSYLFFIAHQGIFFGVAHGLLRQSLQWSWSQVAISALANAVVGMFVYSFLDRFKK